MEKVIFDFDKDKCTACQACVMACFDQNDIDVTHHQHPFRNAFSVEKTTGDVDKCAYLSIACMHCTDAPCVMACPIGCLYKDDETGLTLYDNSNCIGCHSCSMACPFGIPSFNLEGKMVKCDGCVERLKEGMEPACIRVCPNEAIVCMSEEEFNKSQHGKSLRLVAESMLLNP